jgi:hypothetical protein
MKVHAATLMALALAALPAHAHYIWIVPDKQGATAQVIFSEIPEPDHPKYPAKIAHTQLYLRQGDDKESLWAWNKEKEAYKVALPRIRPQTLAAVCNCGVIPKEKDTPYLLMYYAKAHFAAAQEGVERSFPSKPWSRLPLEIVQAEGKGLRVFQLLWQGKPLADAEVVFLPPGKDKLEKRKTGRDGVFDAGTFAAGVYGFRAKHTEAKEGLHDGKQYREIHHYTTIVVELPDPPKPKKSKTPGRHLVHHMSSTHFHFAHLQARYSLK